MRRTGALYLNTPRVDGEIFESGKKKLRIQKYRDTRGLGPYLTVSSLHETCRHLDFIFISLHIIPVNLFHDVTSSKFLISL